MKSNFILIYILNDFLLKIIFINKVLLTNHPGLEFL